MITIVVLLILAGVTIAMLTGENGIINQAKNAKEESLKSELEELVDLTLMEYQTDKATGKDTDLGDVLYSKVGKDFDAVTEEEDCYIVEKNGYEVKVSKDGERLNDAEKIGGIRPQLEALLYQEDGNLADLSTGYETLILTVNIKNKEELGKIDEIKVTDEENDEKVQEESVTGTGDASYKVPGKGTYTIKVKATTDGNQKESTIKVTIRIVPEYWELTTTGDSDWYSYTNIADGNKKAKVNVPQLKGEMAPIKYKEEQTGSKWANAITKDGSMWVWIPRYAYKITSGYHTNTAGTIEIAFIDTNNNFLNGETGKILTDPKAEGAGTTEWLVHPAFTSSAENGGGFGEISGFWVGKFETTGTSSKLTVKPGESSLRNMTINNQYKAALEAMFEEKVTNLNSHMAKNSEWGAITYLAHSKYGVNEQKVMNNNSSEYYTGGTKTKYGIYTTNNTQSTTYNATGVYDMNGGAYEHVASYVNYGTNAPNLSTYGGILSGDIYGSEEERNISTKFKTVYQASGTNSTQSYELCKNIKGDAVYETSNSSNNATGTWHNAYSYFPILNAPFFQRGGGYGRSDAGIYRNSNNTGEKNSNYSFRMIMVF